MSDTDVSILARGIAEFTKHLHARLLKLNANEIFTPIGIHAFLILLSQDPWFQAKDFISTALQADVKITMDRYKQIFTIFKTLNDLSVTNTCFFKQHALLRDGFRNHLRDNFLSDINFLDFAQLNGAKAMINSDIENKTGHKITYFDDIREGSNLSFTNAMQFQNQWADPFASEDTVSAVFHLNIQDNIPVQMMRKKGEFYYKRDDRFGAEILKLPYGNSHLSLVVVLLDNPSNVNQINLHNLTQLTRNMTKSKIDVSLPKFRMNETLQLADSIKGMGLGNVFSADLFNIIDGEILRLSEMEQKVYLEVNEYGSEMASGTLSLLTNPPNKMEPQDGLVIYEANISTEISNRFAKTNMIWRVNNNNTIPAKAEFKVVLTETAFISAFEMEIEGKNYKSYIKEKEQAKNIFNQAVASRQSAGLVETKTRDSTNFVVSVNLEAGSAAVFSLTYEEMLQRVHDQYELILNISPGQIVDDLNVEVRINESRPLKFVKTPPLRSGNEIRTNAEFDSYLEPHSDIKIINSKVATVKFRPDSATQRKIAHFLGKEADRGLSGQFVVQYDVERDPCNGEVLLQDGYFVHFFAPNDLDPLPKHIIFVLDTSSSMAGRKIEQVKDAMKNILSDLRKGDMLHVMEFNSSVIVWDINSKKFSILTQPSIMNFNNPFPFIQRHILPDPQNVNESVIKKAKEVIDEMIANGNTFAIGGLETALYLASEGQKMNENKEEKVYPIVVFLTDGEPNIGVHSRDMIADMVSTLNTNTKAPIFSLSFGDQADRNFLRKLSLKNFGFSRHIYEAADASLQLQNFYKTISSPLLHDITFKYDAAVREVTKTWFPIYFSGSELVVSGRYGGLTFPTVINCCGPRGLISVNSTCEKPVTSLERLWAYLTVKQLLDARESALNPADLTRKAIDIALKYSFVTDVTSLVVVKPNDVISSTEGIATHYSFENSGTPLSGIPSTPQDMAKLLRSRAAGMNSTAGGFGSFGAAPQSFINTQSTGALFGASSQVSTNTHNTAGVFGASPQSFTSTQTATTGRNKMLACLQSSGPSTGTGALFGGSPQGTTNTQNTAGIFGASPQGFTNTQSGAPPNLGNSQGHFGTHSQGFSFGIQGTALPFRAPQRLQNSQRTAGPGFQTYSAPGGLFGTSGQEFQNSQGTTGLFALSQQVFGSLQANTTGDFGTSFTFGGASDTAGSFGTSQQGFENSQAPSFTFGCPPTSSTSLGTEDPNNELQSKEEKTFTVNRPFMVMLQLEKDDLTLILLQGYIYRPY